MSCDQCTTPSVKTHQAAWVATNAQHLPSKLTRQHELWPTHNTYHQNLHLLATDTEYQLSKNPHLAERLWLKKKKAYCPNSHLEAVVVTDRTTAIKTLLWQHDYELGPTHISCCCILAWQHRCDWHRVPTKTQLAGQLLLAHIIIPALKILTWQCDLWPTPFVLAVINTSEHLLSKFSPGSRSCNRHRIDLQVSWRWCS